MGGSGSMLHAISTMKANMALRKSKRIQRNKNYQKGGCKEKEFNFPKVSEEELEKIKSEIRAKGKKQRLVENSIITIITLVVFSLVYIYLF